MKKIIIIILIFFCNSIYWATANEDKIQIIYKVNENIISNIDIDNEAKYLKALNKNFQNIELNKLKEYAAQSLVKEFIKKDEIEKFYEVVYTSSEVDKYIDQLSTRLGFSNKSNFKSYLSQNGIAYNEVRKKFIIEKTWNSLIYEIYNKKVVVNEKEILSKLEKIVKQNNYQETFRLSEIIFSVSNKADFEKKYNKILQDIELMGFDQAAIIHSISDTANFGGEVGWVKASQ
jgi:peptidyl-prolyl cis-trans isomerase SurA